MTQRRRTTVFGILFGIPFFWRFGKKPEKPKPRNGMDLSKSGFKGV